MIKHSEPGGLSKSDQNDSNWQKFEKTRTNGKAYGSENLVTKQSSSIPIIAPGVQQKQPLFHGPLTIRNVSGFTLLYIFVMSHIGCFWHLHCRKLWL